MKKITKKKTVTKEMYNAIKNCNLLCRRCGKTWLAKQMDFHHLPGTKKEFNISNYSKYPWQKVLKEMAKCLTLCKNCHAIEEPRQKNKSGKLSFFGDASAIVVPNHETNFHLLS